MKPIEGSFAKELAGREKPVDWHPDIDKKSRTVIPRTMLRNFIVGRYPRKSHAKLILQYRVFKRGSVITKMNCTVSAVLKKLRPMFRAAGSRYWIGRTRFMATT